MFTTQVALCEDPSVLDTPFYVMEHVKGHIHSDPSLPGLTPQQRTEAYKVRPMHPFPWGWAGLVCKDCINWAPSPLWQALAGCGLPSHDGRLGAGCLHVSCSDVGLYPSCQ